MFTGASTLRNIAISGDELLFTEVIESDRPVGSIHRLNRSTREVSAISEVENPIGLALTGSSVIWAVERPGYLAVLPRAGGLLSRMNFGRTPYGLTSRGNDVYFAYQDGMPALLHFSEGADEPVVLEAGDVLPIYPLVVADRLLFFDATSSTLKASSLDGGDSETLLEMETIPDGLAANETTIAWLEGKNVIWFDRETQERRTLAENESFLPKALQFGGGALYWSAGSDLRRASGDGTVETVVSCSHALTALTVKDGTAFIGATYGLFDWEQQ